MLLLPAIERRIGIAYHLVYMYVDFLHQDPVYTVPDQLGHDIKFNSFKTCGALKPMVILQNLITTNHRKSGRSKNNLKLNEIIVVTM